MLGLLVFIIVIGPLSIILHEAGHCFVARIFRADQVELSVGRGKSIFVWKQNNFRVEVNRFFFLGGYSNYHKEQAFNRFELVWISLAGPLLNLLIFLGTYWISIPFIHLGSLFNLWLCLVNLIPFKVAMQESDGYKVASILWKTVRYNHDFSKKS